MHATQIHAQTVLDVRIAIIVLFVDVQKDGKANTVHHVNDMRYADFSKIYFFQ